MAHPEKGLKMDENTVEKEDWLKQHHKGTEKLNNINCDLTNIANAFQITGNREIASTLYDITTEIEKATENIHYSMGAMISENLKNSQKNAAGMITAILERIVKE